MLIPLGTDRPLTRPTLVNYWLIGLNVAIFIVMALLRSTKGEQAEQDFIASLWLNERALTAWGLATYQFVHGGALHLLGNMVFLWVFGPNVEDRLGRIGYPLFYLIGGVVAGLTHMLFANGPVIGASGAIAAVTGAYFVLFPRTHVRTLLFFLVIGIFEIPAIWFIGFAVAKDVFFSAVQGEASVAYAAHIGGYLFGGGVSFALLATGLLAREAYDLFSIGKQARRRRVFREITSRDGDPWSSGAPAKRLRAEAKEDPRARERAERRAATLKALGADDLDAAFSEARWLIADRGSFRLPRDAHIKLANAAFSEGDHALAAALYERFLSAHVNDREEARIALMLALARARYLDMPADAAEPLDRALKGPLGEEEKALAHTLREEIRAAAE